jgi:hypothetical protein
VNRDTASTSPPIDDRSIHHAVFVVENAQVHDLAHEPVAIVIAVAGPDAHKYQQAGTDTRERLAIDVDTRLADALNDSPQAMLVTACESPCARLRRAARART